MRFVLSLFLLISAVTIVTINGCGNNDSPIEEGRIMMESNLDLPVSKITAEYETATFALG